MKTLNLGVTIDQGADFNLIIGVFGIDGPIDLTGYEFLAQMRSTTEPGSPVAGGAKAYGAITFSANPSNGDTVTVNGVAITFVSATPSGNQVSIGSCAEESACNLFNFLRHSVNVNIALASYSLDCLVITVTYLTPGTAGNAFTLSEASSAIQVSGPALSGGYDPAEFVFTILNQFSNKGQVKWSLPKDQIDGIVASTSNALQLNRQKTPYVFDIKMKDTIDVVTRIVEGIIYISPQATQENFS